MKVLTAITIFIMLFKPIFPLAEYAANYEYISKVLCINKEKPQLKCNGKCHLMQELAKAADTGKPASPNDKKHQVETEWYFDTSSKIELPDFLAIFHPKQLTFYSNLYSNLHTALFFHPPSIV